MSQGTASQQGQQIQAMNSFARQLILRGGVYKGVYQPPAIDVIQPQNPILPASPGPGTVLTFTLRNVGLVKRLYINFNATITAGATSTQTLTAAGLSNFISNVTFFDLGNNQRINSTGWHLTALASAKRRGPFGAAYTTDSPFGQANNNNRIQFAPSSVAANGTSPISFFLEIPFVRNDQDLRGAIFADVTQATMQVQVTLNPNMFVASTADATLAMYKSAGSDLMTLSGLTVQYWQHYLDMLPRDPQTAAPILPPTDIGTAYLLNNTASGLPVVNQDNGAAFINARQYQSVFFWYDNNGTLNVNGTDLNFVTLQSANFTNIYYLNGKMLGLMNRNILGEDFPNGMYMMDFSRRPVDTTQYGNMQIVVNPSSVGGNGAVILYGWEAYGVIGLVNSGGSLQMGAG